MDRGGEPVRDRRLARSRAAVGAASAGLEPRPPDVGPGGREGRHRRDRAAARAALAGTHGVGSVAAGRGSARRRPALPTAQGPPARRAHDDHRPHRLEQARVASGPRGRGPHRRSRAAHPRPAPSRPAHQGLACLRRQRRRGQRWHAVRGRGPAPSCRCHDDESLLRPSAGRAIPRPRSGTAAHRHRSHPAPAHRRPLEGLGERIPGRRRRTGPPTPRTRRRAA